MGNMPIFSYIDLDPLKLRTEPLTFTQVNPLFIRFEGDLNRDPEISLSRVIHKCQIFGPPSPLCGGYWLCKTR